MKNKKTPATRADKKIGKYESGFLKKLLEQLRDARAGKKPLPAEYIAPVKDYRVERGEVTVLRSQFVTSKSLFA